MHALALATVAPSVAVARLVSEAEAFASASMAPATRRAYASDLAAFGGWCRGLGLEPLPAAPGIVAAYLGHLASEGRKASTITRAAAAIATAHKAAGLASPTASAEVTRTLQGIRRTIGCAPRRVAPLEVADLRRMAAVCGEGLQAVRDRALLVVAWAGAFRRSEVVGLEVADLDWCRDGVVVTLRRSKTDQTGEGRQVALPYGSDPATCPVRTLQAWLEASGVQAGRVFRSITRHGGIGAALSDRAVAEIVKARAASVGIDARRVAGHSLRAGFVTSAARAGRPLDSIMRQTGHRSTATTLGYIRRASLFDDNAASGLGL
jgi:site-specific recombinase XerD